MPRGYTYMTRFRCPKCKRAGSAKWEENERVLPHGTGITRLAHLSHGFRSGQHNEIYCAACSEQVVTGHG